MYKQKLLQTSVFLVFTITTLCLLSTVVNPQSKKSETSTSANFDQAADNALLAAKNELLDAAKAHKVHVQMDRILYASDGKTTIVHAPITGIEKYQSADFAMGAPILLVIVKSTIRLAVPNGSYVARAQYQTGATSGKVTFMNRNGAVSAQRDLIIRTWRQSAILFPSMYTEPMPGDEIPNITSVHFIIWDSHGNPHYYFDCSGVNGTLYFEMG
jgi:hypothetical protein